MELLNSVMLLKNQDGWGYATVDLMCIDLFTGHTGFYKYGAAPSYIRTGKTVRRVRGAAMAAGILARLRLPSALTDSVVSAIRNHMRFASVHAMKKAKWMRIIADPNFPLELELHRLDCIACHGLLDNYVLMLDRMREYAKLPVPKKPFLNGDDIIALGVKPGAVFSRILSEAEDLRLEGELKSREQALEWLRARVDHLDL